MRHAHMLAKLEEDTYAFWADFAHRPGGSRGDEEGATWFRSGVPFVNYNGIVGTGGSVEAILARVRGWGLPARWILSSASAPHGFEAKLAAHGLEMFDESPGMVAWVDDLPAPTLGELTVDVVNSDANREAWADVFCDAFGLSPDTATHARDAHAWPCLHDRGRTYLVMRRRGEAVATGLLRTTSGVAGVYGIGVRRAFQKRGLGALATLLTVREGARQGARLATLQATREGFPVYAKLGFRTICSFRSWRIA